MAEVEVEGPCHPNHRELEQHQDQPAGYEIPRQRAPIIEPSSEQVRRSAGEKCEGRRDEVGDPARKEDRRPRAAGRHAGKDAYVIDGHEDHRHTPRDVDRVDSAVSLHAGDYGASSHIAKTQSWAGIPCLTVQSESAGLPPVG